MKKNKDILFIIEKEAKKYFVGAKGSHDWEHTERVFNLVLHIGKKEKADLNVIKIAATLHDIGRKKQDEKSGEICHAELGGKIARKILEKYDFKPEFVEAVAHCIESHRFRGKNIPKTKEAKVLYDADKLDAIGAVGIGRAFLFAGEVGAKLHDPNINIEKTREYTKEDTAYREFLVKLNKIKDKMLTREGKRIAKKRHEFMVEFFDRLNKEIKGTL